MLFLTVALTTLTLLGLPSDSPDRSAQPNIAIVDMGGGGGYISGSDGRFCSRGHSKC
jgi:hypothetical protein